MGAHEFTAADVAAWTDGLAQVQQRIGQGFVRSEQRRRVRRPGLSRSTNTQPARWTAGGASAALRTKNRKSVTRQPL